MTAFRLAPAVLAACAGLVIAADPQQTVTAEGTATATVKPDRAKVYLHVESKAGDAGSAAETNGTSRKELVAAVQKLGLKSATAAVQPQKVTKDRDNSNRFNRVVGPGGVVQNPPPADTFTAGQMVLYTVADADPDKLHDAVEKICLTAAAMGIVGDKAGTDGVYYSPYGETKSGVRVAYSSKAWEPAQTDALAKATEAAMKRAAALAKGAGLTVTGVVSVDELGEFPSKDDSSLIAPRVVYAMAAAATTNDEELVDGELSRKVRVRVKVAVGK